jgi:hypothetical protein
MKSIQWESGTRRNKKHARKMKKLNAECAGKCARCTPSERDWQRYVRTPKTRGYIDLPPEHSKRFMDITEVFPAVGQSAPQKLSGGKTA